MDILTYALAKSYTDKALLGVGTIKGAPCTVKSQTEDDEYVYVTLGWENNLGTSEETVVKIKKGADGAPGKPGPAGDPGPRGISITKIEKIKTEGLIDTYQISFSDDTTFEYTISNGSTDYLNITNKPSIEGVELTGNKTFEDLNIASADALTATDENLQNLSDFIGDKTSLPAPTDTVVNNITSVYAKVDAIIDDNETGLAKTFSSDKITKTFATIEEVNKRIPQYDVLPTPTEAFDGKVVQFIGTTTEDYIHNYFYECIQVEGNYKWINTVVQNIPTKVSELTNDSNFVTETELNEKGYLTKHQDISGKVDKEEGKSLIADSEIIRLSTVKNYDDSVVKEDIATIKTDYATKTYVGEQIASADHLKREIVTEVPTAETAAENVIYMLKVESAIGADKYKEYMLIDGEVACVGDTSVDLTDYAKKDEIPTELPANGGNADTVNTHTVASDVPENAVFTDTWRGIQDNLTSESVSDSLSANQGRILNNNLTALDNSKLKGYTIKYDVPANTGGWHKIAQITGEYFNFDLYATGSWNSQRKSNAHFHIQNTNGTVRIVQLSGLVDTGGGIRKIRMVRVVDDNNTWILEEHSRSSDRGEAFRFTIAGDVTVTPLDGSVDATTDFKDSVSLDVSDIPTGSVITTSNIDNALSSISVNPVQNKVIKAELDKVNRNLTDLKVNNVAGGKNLADINAFKQLTIAEKSDRYGYEWLDMKGGSYTFTITNNGRRVYLGYEHEGVITNPYSVGDETANFTITISDHDNIAVWCDENVKINTITKIQLEEGSEATEYEPYIPSVKTLAEETSSNSEDVNTLKKETTVNLLNPTLKTTTEKGITCTNNGDGTYTLNGTKTTDTIWLQLGTVSLKANKSYKLIGQSSTDTSIDVRVYDNDGVYFGDGTYKGATPIITPIVDTTLSMQIRIAETTLDNFIVKPMITTNLDATYDDFVPYTGNTGGLNSDVAEIRNEVSQQSAKINSNTTSLLGTVHKVYSMEVGNSAVDPVVISDFKIDPGYRYLYIINGSGTTGYEVGILMFINGMKFVPLSSSSGTAMKDSVSAIGIDIYIENGQLKVSRSATSYATTCVIYKLG